MKVFIAIAALVAVISGAPRYLVIPIEDVNFGNFAMAHRFPIYSIPALARQARAAQGEEDSYQIAPASNAYSAPAPAGPDHVDYGAYTGGYGAFGWYTDRPVLLAGH
eukprot:GFUD01126744.1.p1 GENE.GFUD01126744.1~~GFUD01126744.1.p1  ORF type:complete len:107 (-),score=23.64 GFUD01126744.1:136-456(-)